jgi:hypothetical protein
MKKKVYVCIPHGGTINFLHFFCFTPINPQSTTEQGAHHNHYDKSAHPFTRPA